MPDRCVGGRRNAHIDQVEASLIPASPKKPSKACSEEMFDSEYSALGVPFQKSTIVPDTCCSHQVCRWGREKHKESYILKWIASSRRGRSLGEYDSLNALKCLQLWDTWWCLFLVTLRTKLLMMLSPTRCKMQNPTPVTVQSSVIVEVIIPFTEHNNPHYSSEEKEQILPLLVQFPEQIHQLYCCTGKKIK